MILKQVELMNVLLVVQLKLSLVDDWEELLKSNSMYHLSYYPEYNERMVMALLQQRYFAVSQEASSVRE
jgi:hypothetical protein